MVERPLRGRHFRQVHAEAAISRLPCNHSELERVIPTMEPLALMRLTPSRPLGVRYAILLPTTVLTASLASVAAPPPSPDRPASQRRESMMHDDSMNGAAMSEMGMHEIRQKDPSELTQAEISFFESKIRPVLSGACFKCHSEGSRVRGGLRVDTPDALLRGGESGPAIVPGDPDSSILILALRHTDEDYEMPPSGKLSDAVIADFERWVEMGCPDPRARETLGTTASTPTAHAGTMDIEKGREFWAYQLPTRAALPEVKQSAWPRTDVDYFLLHAMEAHDISPVKDADKSTLLRRVTYDLTGLPPSPPEVAAFIRDKSDNAYEQAVDRLLDSSAFGERWGRHWLDVARYAESSGKESNVLYPHAWRYRDWVIDAFNKNTPYDRFLIEQLAGDLLPAHDDAEFAQLWIATGYLALGTKSHNARGRAQFQADLIDEQIDAVSQGLLATTVACARCHDHKFDPIPQKDYYALAGIFASTETRYGTVAQQQNNHPAQLIRLPENAGLPLGPTQPESVQRLLAAAYDRITAAIEGAPTEAELREARLAESRGEKPKIDLQAAQRIRIARGQLEVYNHLATRFDTDGKATTGNLLAMGVAESGRAIAVPLLERGEIDKAGAIVPRGVPEVLCAGGTPELPSATSGRLELAQWIASDTHPLTARVWVNRVWLHLFGKGLVRTPDNFGSSGQAPTHPELLDALAVDFMENGWNTKALIKALVLSHAYQLDSTPDAAQAKNDPDADWYGHMPHRRLEAEAIRDSMLAAAGTLELERPVGSMVNMVEGSARLDQFMQLLIPESRSRSLYLPVVRDAIPQSMQVFDFAESSFVTGDRDETTVPTQALYLLNDENVLRLADAFAQRLQREAGTADERVQRGFLLALGRKPTSAEATASRAFIKHFEQLASRSSAAQPQEAPAQSRGNRRGNQPAVQRIRERMGRSDSTIPNDPELIALSAFCQSLFATAEFRTLD